MIRRQDIRELAEFESPQGCALSFYYQPFTPQNKSHREEVILVKDLIRDSLRAAEKHGKNGCARADLERIQELAENLRGNQGRAKAVFACGTGKMWREFDLPPRLSGSSLFLNRRFHLKPLASILDQVPRVCVALVDRSKARLFDASMDEVREREKLESVLPRRARTEGFIGYDARHIERHFDNEARNHFKKVAERLKEAHENGSCEHLIVGCRDEIWPEFEPLLHPYVRERLLGHFSIDLVTASAEQVKAHARRIIADYQDNHRRDLLREVMGQAHRNGRGALGLRRVLRSLETGEVQVLLLGRNFAAHGVECLNCGHLDIRAASDCTVCGHPNLEVEDIGDSLIGAAIRKGIEVVYVADDPEFEKTGNIAALLRFRADQNTPMKLAV